MIRRLEKTHPNKQWCEKCEGTGNITFGNDSWAFCDVCKGERVIEKEL